MKEKEIKLKRKWSVFNSIVNRELSKIPKNKYKFIMVSLDGQIKRFKWERKGVVGRLPKTSLVINGDKILYKKDFNKLGIKDNDIIGSLMINTTKKTKSHIRYQTSFLVLKKLGEK
mgnify:CR=1 FL=1